MSDLNWKEIIKDTTILQWDVPKIDWGMQDEMKKISRYKDLMYKQMMDVMMYSGPSTDIGGRVGDVSIPASMSGHCRKCSEGLLKIDFLGQSKDNYCDCGDGQRMRTQLKDNS